MRVYICVGIFISIIAFSLFSKMYVRDSVGEVRDALVMAVESYEAGDYEAVDSYTAYAAEKWDKFRKNSFLLADKSYITTMSGAIARVHALQGDMFVAECYYAIAVADHIIKEN